MVSFWPWKGGEDAASFERTLNTLTGKINRATARNDNQKQLARRLRVMWTLYAGFAYILVAVVLTLVTGWQNWGPVEGSCVAGGPVLIYGLRRGLMAIFDYRIRNTDKYVKKLNDERDATIERLKEATKYNSTQQLLEKYGASPKQQKEQPEESPGHNKSQGPQNLKPEPPPGPRTGMVPPPTANIQRSPNQQRPVTPQRAPVDISSLQAPSPVQPPPQEAPGAEFAPNAFGADLTKQYSNSSPTTFTETHWYDRILDALLGEDETQAKNRFALICSQCRLVNGQAPPGARTLEDVGRWRCGGCSAWNGKERPREDDVTKLVRNWEAERKQKDKERQAVNADMDDGSEGEMLEREKTPEIRVDGDSEDEAPPSKGTRSRKAKVKK